MVWKATWARPNSDQANYPTQGRKVNHTRACEAIRLESRVNHYDHAVEGVREAHERLQDLGKGRGCRNAQKAELYTLRGLEEAHPAGHEAAPGSTWKTYRWVLNRQAIFKRACATGWLPGLNWPSGWSWYIWSTLEQSLAGAKWLRCPQWARNPRKSSAVATV